MGWTSENVASDYNISREDQDEFAATSFQRAENAQKLGYFEKEIVPFTVFQKDPASGERRQVVVSKDEGIRAGTTKESLGKIRSAFPQWGKGTTTGGNASQITDGAAAVLLMTRRKAEELGLKVLAKHVSTAVAGKSILDEWGLLLIIYRCSTSRDGNWACIRHSNGPQTLWYYSRRCRLIRGESWIDEVGENELMSMLDKRSIRITMSLHSESPWATKA